MGVGFTDWAQSGIWPLQDHDIQVPIETRQTMVGGRISSLLDTSETDEPDDVLVEYARQDGLGTLGDVHPWAFIQTSDRGRRGMGAWAQSFLGIVSRLATGTVGGGGTGLEALPVADGSYRLDDRFNAAQYSWPRCFSKLPESTLVGIYPTMKESRQELGVLHGDPRLFAPHIRGPAECGTLVCDLQPTAEPCMGTEPGDFNGRTARLQSMMRVVAMPQGGFLLGSGEGNGIAWNLAPSRLDGLQGSGMVWAAIEGGASGPTTGGPGRPITPRGDVVPTTGRVSSGDGVSRQSQNAGTGTQRLPAGARICDSGQFQPERASSQGVAFMDRTASGPFHAGHEDDKHNLGTDRDGNPMNSGHIATNAYFYRSQLEDGPLFFEGPYPYPPPYPLISRVHLTWDPALAHPFVGGTRFGQWRWYAEVPYVSPDGQGPRTPVTQPATPTTPAPSGPAVPAPGAPTTPGPGLPGGPPTPGRPTSPTTPAGGRPTTGGQLPPAAMTPPNGPGRDPRPRGPITGPRITGPVGPPPQVTTPGTTFPPGSTGGQTQPGNSFRLSGRDPATGEAQFRTDVMERAGDRAPIGAYEILHPFANGFASLSFRPQHVVEGRPMATHNPQMPRELLLQDEETRPSVLRAHAWGRQSGIEWDYTVSPEESRSRGGAAVGGLLFAPPELGLEDYVLGYAGTPTTSHYVAAALGVGFALGEPSTTGGLAPLAATLARSTAATRDVVLSQLDSSGTSRDLLTATLTGTGGERKVVANGTTAFGIPRGTTSQRPGTGFGGAVRVNTDAVTGSDVLEFYDAQRDQWSEAGSADPVVSTTTTTVTNSTSFSTISTTAVPQNSMGSNGFVAVSVIGEVIINAAGNPRIQIVWNSNVIQTITHTWAGGTSPTAVPFSIQIQMGNLASAATQFLVGTYTIGGETGTLGVSTSAFTDADTATTDANLEVQVSWDTASASLSWSKLYSSGRIVRR